MFLLLSFVCLFVCFHLSWQQLPTSWLSLLVWMCLLCCDAHPSITLQQHGGPSPQFVTSEGHCVNGAHLSETLRGLHGLCCIYFIRWREGISCVSLSILSNMPLITPSTRGESGYVFTKVTGSASSQVQHQITVGNFYNSAVCLFSRRQEKWPIRPQLFTI